MEKSGNLIERFKGDKVVLIVVLLLLMISMIAISGSTSLLAMTANTTRLSIMTKQAIVSLIGIALMAVCYAIPRIGIFEKLSKAGFIISFVLLAALLTHFSFKPFIWAEKTNEVYRVINVLGQQFHVFEIVKVAMIMYISWACKAVKEDNVPLLKKIAGITTGKEHDRHPFAWLDNEWGKLFFYIFIPIGLITVLILPGSNSSAVFIGGMMVLTTLVGGVDIRKILLLGVIMAGLLASCYGIYRISDRKVFSRIGTGLERMADKPTIDDLFRTRTEEGVNSRTYKKMLKKVQQPYSAKIAIHEGGMFRKGVGGSTQKYVVPVMYGDFMFSYILEETGIAGGLAIIILYLSLMARGVKIVQNCEDSFGRTAAGSLILLIVCQAFMHIAINLDLGPLTGQTLPLVSHGSSAFLCFCIAFGVILSISKHSWERTSAEERQADIESGRINENGNNGDINGNGENGESDEN